MKLYQNNCHWVIEDYLDINFVEEIKRIIQENLDILDKDKKGYSTTGKDAEQYWLVNLETNFFIEDLRFYEFEKRYKKQIFDRIKRVDRFERKKDDDIILQCLTAWSVVGEEHSYHTIHSHGDFNFDGVTTILYLSVPETNCEDTPANNIYLVTDAGSSTYHKKSTTLTVNPEVGKLLIFPTWTLHGTYPQSKGIRQTLNMDYGIKIKNKNLSYL